MKTYQALFDLKDRTVVITGASGILGEAFCRALCEYGATVFCLDIQEESLNVLVNDLNHQYGAGCAYAYVCDVASSESVNKTIASIIADHKKIDVLINNAASKTDNLKDFFEPFSEYALKTWQEVMAVNLDGMFLMAQAVGKHMVVSGIGNIIQTTSIYSLLGPDQRIYEGSSYLGNEINTPAVYTASKAGVIGLTKHLATLWGSSNIRVNALCPGGVSSGQNNTFSNNYARRVPLGRMANTIDIIGPMLFLACDASQYMTGQVISADGGLSAW